MTPAASTVLGQIRNREEEATNHDDASPTDTEDPPVAKVPRTAMRERLPRCPWLRLGAADTNRIIFSFLEIGGSQRVEPMFEDRSCICISPGVTSILMCICRILRADLVPLLRTIPSQRYMHSLLWVRKFLHDAPKHMTRYFTEIVDVVIKARGVTFTPLYLPPSEKWDDRSFHTNPGCVLARRRGWEAFLERAYGYDASKRAELETQFHRLTDAMCAHYGDASDWNENNSMLGLPWKQGIHGGPAGNASTPLEAMMQLGIHRGLHFAGKYITQMWRSALFVYGEAAFVALAWLTFLDQYASPYTGGHRNFFDHAAHAFWIDGVTLSGVPSSEWTTDRLAGTSLDMEWVERARGVLLDRNETHIALH